MAKAGLTVKMPAPTLFVELVASICLSLSLSLKEYLGFYLIFFSYIFSHIDEDESKWSKKVEPSEAKELGPKSRDTCL